ncbi:unnamed protein product [Calicophoron daubneyi]|uniref:Uncharacterized protein n=1 Tax=Calicophoron daubneyi TaxID=300641 RepID=A0AAV2TIY8_CALDB
MEHTDDLSLNRSTNGGVELVEDNSETSHTESLDKCKIDRGRIDLMIATWMSQITSALSILNMKLDRHSMTLTSMEQKIEDIQIRFAKYGCYDRDTKTTGPASDDQITNRLSDHTSGVSDEINDDSGMGENHTNPNDLADTPTWKSECLLTKPDDEFTAGLMQELEEIGKLSEEEQMRRIYT